MRWTQAGWVLVSAAMAAGCSPQPSAIAATSGDKVYSVTPDSLRVQAGSVAGEILRMRVTERIEEGSGRITSPARLSGRLFLENVSADAAIHLIGGSITYLDAQGQPIPLENGRAEPKIRFGAADYSSGRLEPGKSATELLYAEFPAAALEANRLKAIQIRLAFSQPPAAQGEERLDFAVSIGQQPAPQASRTAAVSGDPPMRAHARAIRDDTSVSRR